MIFCGVLDKHPNLKVVFTEQGSAWVRPKLAAADYTWKGSYVRSDLREVRGDNEAASTDSRPSGQPVRRPSRSRSSCSTVMITTGSVRGK